MAADSFFAQVALHVPGNGRPGSKGLLDLSQYRAAPIDLVAGVQLDEAHVVGGAKTSIHCAANSGSWWSAAWGGGRFLIPANTVFTLEFDAYVPSWASYIGLWNFASSEAAGRCQLYASASGYLRWNRYGESEFSFGPVPSAGAWHRYVYERDGSNNIRCWVDNVVLPSAVGFGGAIGNGGGGLCMHYGGQAWFANVNLVVGTRRYAGSVAAPTGPHPALGEVAGQVLDSAAAPAERLVRAYRRDTGELVGQGYSDATTGEYALAVSCATTVEMNVLCLDDDAGSLANDLVLRTFPL